MTDLRDILADFPFKLAESNQAFEVVKFADGTEQRVYMRTFAGTDYKIEGNPVTPEMVKPTREEAIAEHVPALKRAMLTATVGMKDPLVFLRMGVTAVLELSAGGFVALSRFGVCDLEKQEDKREVMVRRGAPYYCWERRKVQPPPIRGVVMTDQPVVGVAQ